MDRKKATKLLGIYNEGSEIGITPKGVKLVFARQQLSDIEEIENMTDDNLLLEYRSLVWINYIYGQISLNEMERISLMDLEIAVRKSINLEELKLWFKETNEKHKIQEQEEIEIYEKEKRKTIG